MKDDEIIPRLGKIRAKGRQSYLPKVLKAARKAGGLKSVGRGGKGIRYSRGRGAGIAAVTAGGRANGPSARRVVIKSRYTQLAGKGLKAARDHLRYLQRDGVTPEGKAGTLYDRRSDQADGRAFMDRAADDPRQFRFIVSAEDGDKYQDLKPLMRRFMKQMETDLGTALDWVAVDHHNTGHPHTHIVVRGRDDMNKDLVIAKDYISEGMRDRLQALVTLDLGPRTEHEIDLARRQEVEQARLTSLDRQLIRTMSLDRIVEPEDAYPSGRALQVARLARLRAFGLAEELDQGRWRLAEGLDATLRRMGERGDTIKSLHRELALKGMSRAGEESIIHEAGELVAARSALVGQVLRRGLLDGEVDRHFLMIDATDGRVHWIDIGLADRTRPISDGALVRVAFREPVIRLADQTIAEVAAAHDGRYDIAAHLNYDQTATEAFAQTHVRRLEAIGRMTGKVHRAPDGTFGIDANYLDHALAYEVKRVRQAPADVQPLSPIPLSRLPTYNGATWLDRELIEPTTPLVEAGFGADAATALRQRQAWLLREELAIEQDRQFLPNANMLSTLETRDLETAGKRLSKLSGLPYTPGSVGDRVEGLLRQSVHLPSGKFAMVERGKDFTLVPWRSVLEDHVGKPVSGIYRDAGINWTIGKSRGRGVNAP